MYKKKNKGWQKHLDFLIIDMLSLEAAFFLAYTIRHGIHTNFITRQSYFRMIFVLLLIDFVSMAVAKTFSGVMRRGYFDEFTATFKQALIVTLMSTLYLFSIQEGGTYSRITLFLTGLLYQLISYATRLLWKIWLISKKPVANRSLIIITTLADAEHMIHNFERHGYSDAGITGIALTDISLIGKSISGIRVVADKDTVEEYVLSEWVDEVIFGIHVNSELVNYLQRVFIEMGVTVHQALLEVHNDSPVERHVERIGGYTVITRSVRILTTEELIMKRLLDIAGGIVGCLITTILLIFVAPAIYIASPGPIFFSQERIGKNGKIFKMYKFRSMYLDAEERLKELQDQNEMDSIMFKMHDDPRIIGSEKGSGKGIGNFIRKTSIDEFPQFWNVLTGSMSLVGTRPPLVSEWNQYEAHHRARMATKPGITGMWQISGRNNVTDFEKIVEYDTEYIENWSFGLDIKILFKTVAQIVKGEGAM